MKTSTLRSVVECRRQLGFPDITARYFGDFEFTLFSKKSIEIVHCSIGPQSFGGFGFILLFWEKIYKSENSHAALPSVSNPRAFFSQRNPERFGRHALFGQQLESLKVSKSAPPSGCCWGNHENNPVRRNNLKKGSKNVRLRFYNFKKFIFQSSDLEDR